MGEVGAGVGYLGRESDVCIYVDALYLSVLFTELSIDCLISRYDGFACTCGRVFTCALRASCDSASYRKRAEEISIAVMMCKDMIDAV